MLISSIQLLKFVIFGDCV